MLYSSWGGAFTRRAPGHKIPGAHNVWQVLSQRPSRLARSTTDGGTGKNSNTMFFLCKALPYNLWRKVRRHRSTRLSSLPSTENPASLTSGKTEFYLVDPQSGSLAVRADGGSGGHGFDGSPGRGGPIAVTYDPQAKSYLGVPHLSSRYGPPPAFRESPVAPLW
jgi:hypothetical protein